MLTLHELKEPYEQIIRTLDTPVESFNCQELVSKLNSNSIDSDYKNIIVSILIYRSWQSLINIYYKKSAVSLTAEECYDIFLEAFEYVCKTEPWKNENSSLNNDKDAFLKSMMVCTKSRKLNYIIAQHRQKRILNQNTISMDVLEEDFQQGFFNNSNDLYTDFIDDVILDVVKSQFSIKNYMAAFVLDAVVYNNVYDDENNLSIKKLRKYINNLSNLDCIRFASMYGTNIDETINSLKYLQHLNTNILTDKIKCALNIVKDVIPLKEALF